MAENLTADSSNPIAKPFALTISGGTSLGVYEAGLNWAIIEALRQEHFDSDGEYFQLQAVTGASAGAINTLLSAQRFCESKSTPSRLENNAFYRSWNIGIEQLLPPDGSGYDQFQIGAGDKKKMIPDSVFARGAFSDAIGDLRRSFEGASYRLNCSIDVAVSVTHSQPQRSRVKLGKETGTINIQRFIIPFRIYTEKAHNSDDVVLRIHNRSELTSGADELDNYLFLPSSNDGQLEFDDVAKAVLASSAFPLAFSRVQMSYCASERIIDSEARTAESECPQGYLLSEGYFIDGGVFDNIPLRAAINQVELGAGKDADYANYIFLDPDTLRSSSKQLGTGVPDVGSITLGEQVRFVAPTVRTLREQELHSTLVRYFNNAAGQASRSLLLSRRGSPITGYFISNFGAFIDRTFRSHDYAVGVYDGLWNVANYLCGGAYVGNAFREARCPSGVEGVFTELAYKIVLSRDPQSCAHREDLCVVISLLSEADKMTFPWSLDSGNPDRPVFATELIHRVLNEEDIEDFDDFIQAYRAALISHYEAKGVVALSDYIGDLEMHDGIVRDLVNRDPPDWKNDILLRIVKRLHELEEQYGGPLEKKLAAAVALFPETQGGNSAFGRSPYGLRRSTWEAVVPEFIGVDGAQTGAVMSWDFLRGFFHDARTPGRRRFDVGGYVRLGLPFSEIDSERNYSTGLGLSLNFSRPESFLFTSFGTRHFLSEDKIGISPNGDPERDKFGSEVYMDFLGGRVRLAVGNKDLHDPSGDWTLQVGVADIWRLLPLLGNRRQ